MLRVVRDKELLHAKVNNKDVYVDYGATEDISEDACILRQHGWRIAFFNQICLHYNQDY